METGSGGAMDEVRRFENVGLIYDEAKLGTNTSDAHDATKATPHAGESVTTALTIEGPMG